MSAEDLDWQELNAYVDGELPADRASVVAEAIARRPDLARQAALLNRLKAATAASVQVPEALGSLPPPRRHPRRGALAAAIGLLLLLAGAFWLRVGIGGHEQEAWVREAIALHHELGETRPAGGPVQAGPVVAHPLTASLDFISGFPPDLSAAKLSAGRTWRIDSHALGTGAAVQYRGTRGCKVSLILLEEAAESLPESLQKTAGGDIEVYRWRVGAIGYLLLAEAMDSQRLSAIAQAVHEASRRLRPLDERARTRLADSRERSAPCRA